MKCDSCHVNEASLHVKEVRGDKTVSIHLCHECAARKGVLAEGHQLDLASLVYNLTAQALKPHNEQTPDPMADAAGDGGEQKRCSACGLTAATLRENWRLGCQNCYHAFKDVIDPMLGSIHRGVTHCGKTPGSAGAGSPSTRDKDAAALPRLREELARAVARRATNRRPRFATE